MPGPLSLFDHVPIGLFSVDSSWVLRSWNRCMAEWTGIAAEKAVGRPATDLLPRLAEPRYRRRVDPIFSGGPPVILSYQLNGDLFPDPAHPSSPRPRHTTVTYLEEGSAILALFAVEDRSDAASRLREARSEIERRLKTEEELRKAVAYREALAREISHRVKNNLVLIQGLIDVEFDDLPEGPTRDKINELQGRIASIATLHDSLYRSADPTEVELRGYFGALAETMFRTFLPRGSEARFELDVESSWLSVDATLKLGLVATELLTNAIKHALKGRRGGLVRLSITRPGGGLRLEVADDGPGFGPRDSVGAGTGMGTRIVAILAEELGGRLLLPSAGGTSAVLAIPAGAPCLRGSEGGEPGRPVLQ